MDSNCHGLSSKYAVNKNKQCTMYTGYTYIRSDLHKTVLRIQWYDSYGYKVFNLIQNFTINANKLVPHTALLVPHKYSFSDLLSIQHQRMRKLRGRPQSLEVCCPKRGWGRITWSSQCRKKEPSERRVLLARLPLGSHVLPAPDTVTPALGYTTTPESATYTKTPLSFEMEGGRRI